MVESVLERRLKVIVDKCNEAKAVIERAISQAAEDEKGLVDKAKSHTNMQLLLEVQRQNKRLLADFERLLGKVEFVMDCAVLLQQLQSKEEINK